MSGTSRAKATAIEPVEDWRRILDLLATRRSCRDFDGKPIDRAELEDIVRDGIEAPSSCNHQNWHFVIIDDREMMRRAREISGGNHHFSECSALILLCFQKGWTHGNFSIAQSVAGACYHMMLSTHLRGYAAIWNAGIGDKAQLAEMCDVPPLFEIQGILAIGRPKPTAPEMKAPRRPLEQVMSWNQFSRPPVAVYPAKPSDGYPFERMRNDDNPFAEWDPRAWGWDQLGDFRGYAVWAKSPIEGVYVSARQGEATGIELDLLGDISAGAELLEIMPWGGTHSVALAARLPASAELHLADLSANNLIFIRERFHQSGLPLHKVHEHVIAGPHLPFAEASLDAVLLPQVLEHMPEPEAMLAELARVLKPDGVLAVSARNMESDYGALWRSVESRGQIPNQGPFTPIPATTLRGWLARHFQIEREIGVGVDATHDAEVREGNGALGCRLYAARCRPLKG